MHVIIANFGNDSVALLRYAYEQKIADVYVVYIKTGWQACSWSERVKEARALVKSYGFNYVELVPDVDFTELVRNRHNFPTIKFHWCANFLKGLPVIDWLDEVDVDLKATVVLAKRRQEAVATKDLPEFIEHSELYSDRQVWHPLYKHSLEQRDALVAATAMPLISTRSLECQPCIYSQIRDYSKMSEQDVERLTQLEEKVGKPMFKRAITSDADLANGERDTYYSGCGSEFGCGL